MRYLFVLLTAVLVFSCGNSKQAELDMLTDEVMALHDEVMPLMDDLYTTRVMLQKKMAEDSTIGPELMPTIGDLKAGEDAMMDWMHNFNLSFEGETMDATFDYFQERKEAIERVGVQMRDALADGKAKLTEVN